MLRQQKDACKAIVLDKNKLIKDFQEVCICQVLNEKDICKMNWYCMLVLMPNGQCFYSCLNLYLYKLIGVAKERWLVHKGPEEASWWYRFDDWENGRADQKSEYIVQNRDWGDWGG